MTEIAVSREVSASAKDTWAIFSEISSYEHWNPFIVKAVGMLRLNTQLHMTIVTPAGTRVSFSPRVIELTRDKRMAWATGMRLPGLFTRVVNFEVKPTGDESCVFTVTVAPRGLLVPLRRGFISGLEAGYSNMLDALKIRAEAAGVTPVAAAS